MPTCHLYLPVQVVGLVFHFSSMIVWRLLAALVWVMKSRDAVSVYTTSSSLACGPRLSFLVTVINTPLVFNSAVALKSAIALGSCFSSWFFINQRFFLLPFCLPSSFCPSRFYPQIGPDNYRFFKTTGKELPEESLEAAPAVG